MVEMSKGRGPRKSRSSPATPRRQPHHLYAMFLAVLSLVSWPVPVSAQETEAVHGCSYLNVGAASLGNGWALMREDGKILTTEAYCSGGEASDGLFLFYRCGENGWAYLTADGTEVLRTQPGRLSAGPFSEGLAAVEKETNRWGYMDQSGNLVIAARFEFAHPFNEGLAAVYFHKQWQYIDRTGRTVLRPKMLGKRTEFAFEFKNGAALVGFARHKVVTRGLIDHAGRWIVKPGPYLGGELENGMALYWSKDGKIGYVDSSGQLAIAPMFSGASLLPFQEGIAAAYIEVNGHLKAGFIDKHGNWAIPARFDGALHFCGGLAPVKFGDLWGYINQSGATAIGPRFEKAESFDAGTASVVERDSEGKLRSEVIDRTGRILYRSTGEWQTIQLD
jgi:WG repeat protein